MRLVLFEVRRDEGDCDVLWLSNRQVFRSNAIKLRLGTYYIEILIFISLRHIISILTSQRLLLLRAGETVQT